MTNVASLRPERFISWLARETVTRAPPGKPFVLASGEKSDYYLNLKNVLMDRWFIEGVAPWFYTIAVMGDYELISGMEAAAIPLISMLCTYNAVQELASTNQISMNGFFIRKAAKVHGTQSQIEYNKPLTGKRVLVLEDVVTTGQSSLAAINVLREAGAIVTEVACIVDREEEGASTLFAANGIMLTSLYRGSELLNAY
jgi:orotate phosphoribosyltransferase